MLDHEIIEIKVKPFEATIKKDKQLVCGRKSMVVVKGNF